MLKNVLKNKKVRGILQVAFRLGLLAWLVQKVGPAAILAALTDLDPVWYMVALGLFLLNVVLRAYRWHILLHSLNDRPPFWELAYLYFVGFFFNNFIPSGFGGDVVKVVSLRQSYGRGAEALSSVVMDRLTGLMGSSLIALFALWWNSLSHTTTILLPGWLMGLVLALSLGVPAGFLLLRWTEPLAWLAERLPFTRPVTTNARLINLSDTVRRYPLPVLVNSLLISIPFTLSLIMVQYAVARSLDVDADLHLFGLFVPIIAIINLLPISFNGLGTREGVYLLLFVPAGIPSEQAIAMSLAFYFLRFTAGMLGGLMLAIKSIAAVARHRALEKARPGH